MGICFVIQPFDSGKFDKRFTDVYKPAIEAAGLEAYRVDNDLSVSIPIDSIENGIKQASVCLADITSDNPNVWYELGYAFACGKPVIMVCSEERTGKKYPFDIQHRSIMPYTADAPSDFDKLRDNLTAKVKAIMEQGKVLEQIAEADLLVPIEGLSSPEILALAVIAGGVFLPGDTFSVYVAKRDAEVAGLTKIGFNIAMRRLTAKQFIEILEDWEVHTGEPYEAVRITENGWGWIEENESRFALHKPERVKLDSKF
jgi:hypothetical protein